MVLRLGAHPAFVPENVAARHLRALGRDGGAGSDADKGCSRDWRGVVGRRACGTWKRYDSVVSRHSSVRCGAGVGGEKSAPTVLAASSRIRADGTPFAAVWRASMTALRSTVLALFAMLVASSAVAAGGPGVPAAIHHYESVVLAAPDAATAGEPKAGGPLSLSFRTLGRQ